MTYVCICVWLMEKHMLRLFHNDSIYFLTSTRFSFISASCTQSTQSQIWEYPNHISLSLDDWVFFSIVPRYPQLASTTYNTIRKWSYDTHQILHPWDMSQVSFDLEPLWKQTLRLLQIWSSSPKLPTRRWKWIYLSWNWTYRRVYWPCAISLLLRQY